MLMLAVTIPLSRVALSIQNPSKYIAIFPGHLLDLTPRVRRKYKTRPFCMIDMEYCTDPSRIAFESHSIRTFKAVTKPISRKEFFSDGTMEPETPYVASMRE